MSKDDVYLEYAIDILDENGCYQYTKASFRHYEDALGYSKKYPEENQRIVEIFYDCGLIAGRRFIEKED